MENTIGKEVRRWAPSRGQQGARWRRSAGTPPPWRACVAAGLATVALVLLCAPAAWAQNSTITLTESQISRTQYRDDQSLRWWISYEDCVRGDAFTFPLNTNTNSNLIEVWAGNDDCVARRGQQDRGQCWIVAAAPPDTPQTTIIVPVRNVVAQSIDTPLVPMDYDASVCEGSIDPDGQSVTFYFFFQDGGKALPGGTTWDAKALGGTGFDLVGPSPPGSVSVSVGESQLTISIGNVDEEGDRERFEAFCVPEGLAPALDAGGAATTGDGGVPPLDAGGSVGAAPAECFTTELRAGQRAPLGYSCGIENETSGKLRTSPLINNVTYAVAVAGQDLLGNAGVLSEIRCGTPIVLNDFYEMYSDRGGLGGGGFCNLSFTHQSSEQGRLMALGLFFAALLWRRTRSRE